jgi:hypothetical protein
MAKVIKWSIFPRKFFREENWFVAHLTSGHRDINFFTVDFHKKDFQSKIVNAVHKIMKMNLSFMLQIAF